MTKNGYLVTKRSIQIALGLLWLFDGLLQLQHQMFTNAFADKVISLAAVGQPPIIYGPIHFEVHLLLLHPAVFNSFFAGIQLLLGVCILFKRTAKFGLLASVFWALGVWFFGEGLGGLLGGAATLWMGTSGAALFYAVLALAVLPKNNASTEKPAYWLPIVWAITWIGGSLLQLQPSQNSASSLSSMVTGMSHGAPSWLANADIHGGNFIYEHGSGLFALILTIQILIGFLIFFPGTLRKLSIILGTIMAIFIWVLGENFGTLYSGIATDPNSGPLLILLGIAILGCSGYNFRKLWQKTWSGLEKAVT